MVRYIYIHIPFCLKKCIYCDFYSAPDSASLVESYIEALCKEIEMRKESVGIVEAIYIGGGTPSVLKEKDIEKIMGKVFRACTVGRDAEITAEANPGTLTDGGIRAMLDAGINRISIGMQSLNDNELTVLGRMHDSDEAIRAFHAARRGGFDNISLDLMYGIPGQDIISWKRTLEKVVSLHPEHISTYELTPEKNTVLYAQLEKGRLHLPDEDDVAEMYCNAIDMFTGNGYVHYEISNFALPGHECRHNLNYWNRGEYLGIGAAAHSFQEGRRSANISDVGRYIGMIEKGKLSMGEDIVLDTEDELKELLFLGLRKTKGLDMNLVPAEIAAKMKEALRDLAHQGLIEYSDGHLKLTRTGLLLCNQVIVRLMLCIEQNRSA